MLICNANQYFLAILYSLIFTAGWCTGLALIVSVILLMILYSLSEFFGREFAKVQ